jgi:hypothetical protein
VKFRAAALCLVLVALPAQATDRWSFDTKLAVTGEPVSGVYPHLDGAGRKHIAIASEAVAATWEDNRSGAPQVYVALKANDRNRFATAMQVSGGGEAYEPAIASLPQNRFALAWEQDGSIHARVLTDDGLGMPVALGSAGASHVSLASFGSRVFASWREQRDRLWFVKVAALSVTAAGKLGVESITSVEAAGLETQVLFPSIAVNDAGLSVAWEDRRAGHTRLLVSHSPDQAQSFGEPQHLNEFLSNRNQYDQGNGVTRVSLASFAQDEILAAWMDKRRGGLGYGIFAALGSDGGAIFGPNEKVHGEAGDKQPHYKRATRTAISSSPGTISGAATRISGSAPITRTTNGARISARQSRAAPASSHTPRSRSTTRADYTCCGSSAPTWMLRADSGTAALYRAETRCNRQRRRAAHQ